jgi:cell division protein ZapE
VKLVVGAEAQPEELFTEGEHSAEFQRTVSRLHEMQSVAYLQSERSKR